MVRKSKMSGMLAWSAAALACLGCSAEGHVDGPEDEGSSMFIDIPTASDDVAPEVTDEPRGNLTPERRQLLEDLAADVLASLPASTGLDPVGDDTSREEVGDVPGNDALGNNDPTDHAVKDEAPATLDPEESFRQFLGSVYESPTGGYAVGDIFFPTGEDLIDTFAASYTGHVDKGIIQPTRAWPAPRNLRVCWTPQSNATDDEKKRIVKQVQARWSGASDVTFDFGASPSFRTCAEVPCGFFTCPANNEEIRIHQNSAVTRGCAPVGTDHLLVTNMDCGFGVFSDYASMYLPTTAASSANFVAYTAVHEFGHAMGLLHEQRRAEYNYGIAGVRNCSSADIDETVPGSNPPTRKAPTNGQLPVGAFDDISIMYYCHTNDFSDPRVSDISVGDIFSVRQMYVAPSFPVIFQYSSWIPASVQLTLSGVNFTVSSTHIPNTLNTALNRVVGDSYTPSSVSLNGSRVRCVSKGRAEAVFGGPQVVPPSGFAASPVFSECYDPAAAAAVTAAVL